MTQGPSGSTQEHGTQEHGTQEHGTHEQGTHEQGTHDGGTQQGTPDDDVVGDAPRHSDTQERLLVDTVVDAPADAVWDALRDPDRIRRWFGWDDDGLEAEIRQIFLDDVSADDDARTLAWAHGDRITIEPEAGEPARTHLRLTRRGHPENAWDGVHDPVDEGWITFTQQLRFLLERHPGDDRRTVMATRVDLGPDDDALLDRLGLRSLGDDPVGSRYTVTRPDGSTFSGEVFFQTDLQIGLTVDEEDGALLVVSRTPPASAPPHGTATFLLSLFGDLAADEDRRAATERRWRDWWGG